MKLNITRMDSKGRISIPFGLRHYFGLDCGDELRLEINGNDEIVVMPLSKNFSDCFKNIAGLLKTNGANILETKNGLHPNEISITLDANSKALKKLKKNLSEVKNVKDVKIRILK